MKAQNLDAFIIPSSDPHQSEYVAEHWQFRQWISGFSGSAGLVFVTENYAGLSTDSRYFIQAEEELKDNEFILHRQKVPHQPDVITWLTQNLPHGSTVGIDPRLFSINQVEAYRKKLSSAVIELVFSDTIIDQTWTARPALPLAPIFELSKNYTGKTRQEKMKAIRDTMRKTGTQHHLISTLDDIAWIFNIRGRDVDCNPVVIAYAIIELNRSHLFIDDHKVPSELKKRFTAEGIHLKPYASIIEHLQQIPSSEKIRIDPTYTNAALYNAIPPKAIVSGNTISTALKAKKNPVEIDNIKKAMLKDGVALTKLYRWLEETLLKGTVPETAVADKLIEFRRAQGEYYGESFSAIVGYEANGAIVHYRAQQDTCAAIQRKGMLLVDSGGQYYCGTTDITRTIGWGPLTPEQKRNYTLVLKGHIAVARLRFPQGTRGHQIDLLARRPLWDYGLNYGHGTGHGVGYFLNVHEGPQSISSAQGGKAAVAFEAGMLTSNEPGFYKTGGYGIRIENLILCVEDQETDYGSFLRFETLTLFPIATNLLDFSLLSREEVNWLNEYHQKVEKALTPLLDEDEQIWLKEQCKAI